MLFCPLCFSQEFSIVSGPNSREYYLCLNCTLIFTNPKHHLPPPLEKKRYQQHQNGLHDEGYVGFLYTAIDAAKPFLTPKMKGLDYGCGPVPTLSQLLAQEGFTCYNYDPFFYPKLSKRRKYDFIFSTETFEHLRQPAKNLSTIKSFLKPEGVLVVMTSFWEDLSSFKDWYYPQDPTHIIFFHSTTFDWICQNLNWEKVYQDQQRITILRKPD